MEVKLALAIILTALTIASDVAESKSLILNLVIAKKCSTEGLICRNCKTLVRCTANGNGFTEAVEEVCEDDNVCNENTQKCDKMGKCRGLIATVNPTGESAVQGESVQAGETSNSIPTEGSESEFSSSPSKPAGTSNEETSTTERTPGLTELASTASEPKPSSSMGSKPNSSGTSIILGDETPATPPTTTAGTTTVSEEKTTTTTAGTTTVSTEKTPATPSTTTAGTTTVSTERTTTTTAGTTTVSTEKTPATPPTTTAGTTTVSTERTTTTTAGTTTVSTEKTPATPPTTTAGTTTVSTEKTTTTTAGTTTVSTEKTPTTPLTTTTSTEMTPTTSQATSSSTEHMSTATEPTSTTTTDKPKESNYTCKQEGIFEDSSNCTMFYMCKSYSGNLVAYHGTCRRGTHFDRSSKRCVPGECKNPTTNSPPTGTCESEGTFLNTTDCTRFYKCTYNGSGYDKKDYVCRKGSYFSASAGRCVQGSCKSTSKINSLETTASSSDNLDMAAERRFLSVDGIRRALVNAVSYLNIK